MMKKRYLVKGYDEELGSEISALVYGKSPEDAKRRSGLSVYSIESIDYYPEPNSFRSFLYACIAIVSCAFGITATSLFYNAFIVPDYNDTNASVNSIDDPKQNGVNGESSEIDSQTQERISKKLLAIPFVKAFDLHREYLQNEVSADLKYQDEEIAVRGMISTIANDDYSGNPYITFTTLNNYSFNQGLIEKDETIKCYFSNDDAREIAGLNSGDMVTVKGLCQGYSGLDGKIGIVILKDCNLAPEVQDAHYAALRQTLTAKPVYESYTADALSHLLQSSEANALIDERIAVKGLVADKNIHPRKGVVKLKTLHEYNVYLNLHESSIAIFEGIDLGDEVIAAGVLHVDNRYSLNEAYINSAVVVDRDKSKLEPFLNVKVNKSTESQSVDFIENGGHKSTKEHIDPLDSPQHKSENHDTRSLDYFLEASVHNKRIDDYVVKLTNKQPNDPAQKERVSNKLSEIILLSTEHNPLAWRAFEVWGGKDSIKFCLDIISSPESRRDDVRAAINYLSTAATDRNKVAIAEHISKWLLLETKAAEKAMIELGPVSEEFAIKYLDSKEHKSVKLACINILSRVGATDAVDALQKYGSDNDVAINSAARNAYHTVRNRLKADNAKE